MLGPLLAIGTLVGVAFSALGHPKIYRAVFGGPYQSDDH